EQIRWMLSDLEVGESRQFDLTLGAASRMAPGESVLQLSARVQSQEFEHTAEPLEFTTHALPRFEIESHVDQDSAHPGDSLNYRFTVTNVGNADAADTVLSMRLPPHTELVNVLDGARFEASSQCLRYPVGCIEPGNAARLMAHLRLDTGFPAGDTTIETRVFAEAAHVDGLWSDTVSTLVQARAEIVLDLRTENNEAHPGDPLNCTAVLDNRGNAKAQNVEILLNLPPWVQPTDNTTNWDPGTRILRFEIPSIEPSAHGEFDISLVLASHFPHGTTRVDIAATVVNNDGKTQESQCGVWVYAAPALQVEIQGPVDQVSVGGAFPLEISVSNGGNAIAEDVELTLSLPRHSRPSKQSTGGQHDKDHRTVSWMLGRVGPEECMVKHLPIELAKDFPAGTTTMAFRAVAASAQARLTADQIYEVSVSATPEPHTHLLIQCDTLEPGAIVDATVHWRNEGDAQMTDGSITLDIGRYAHFESATAGGRFEASSCSIKWSVREIGPGTEANASARLRLADVFPEGETPFAPVLVLTSAEVPPVKGLIDPLLISAAPKLEIERTQHVDISRTELSQTPHSASYALAAMEDGDTTRNEIPVGSVITCKVHVSNQGNADARDAEIHEDLPFGATFVSVSDAG
ncbi:MAG TPA: DUF11 domain-containing protein, partial [Myxococcales bacterium]|nr:DUF11 domain-containing protein [Myxococcales bacterium]